MSNPVSASLKKVSYHKISKILQDLRAYVDEKLRPRLFIEGGLPRLVPEGGIYVAVEWLKGRTIVSILTHTIHHDPYVFHERRDEYIPENGFI